MDPSVIKWCKWYKELERLFSWLRFGTLRSECCGKIRGFRVEPQICSLFPECGRPACPLDLFHTFSALCQAFSSSRKWQPWSTPPPLLPPTPPPKEGTLSSSCALSYACDWECHYLLLTPSSSWRLLPLARSSCSVKSVSDPQSQEESQ